MESPVAMYLLKELIVDMRIDFSKWIDLTTVKEEDDILIRKKGGIFRFKNRLTEEVVMSQFQDQITAHATRASQEAETSSQQIN